MSPDEHDEMLNNILCAGAVFMALLQAGVETRVDIDENDDATNMLVVRFPFLHSEYRLTVERIPNTEDTP